MGTVTRITAQSIIDFLGFSDFFLYVLDFSEFFIEFFLGLFVFFSKLLRLPLDTKISQKIIISCFFARRAKKALGRSPPQEIEVGPRSGPYLLVLY